MSCYIHRSFQLSAKHLEANMSPQMTDPDFSELIDVRYMRRMSPLLLMGVYSAMKVITDTDDVASIISGTGLGCIKDTYTFLTKLVELDEQGVTPTAFIQSTHNTLAGTLGILCKNHGYNITWTQSYYTFYFALRDAIRQSKLEADKQHLLVAGDEMTDEVRQIIRQMPCGDNRIEWMPCSSAFLLSSAIKDDADWMIQDSHLLTVSQFEQLNLKNFDCCINANSFLQQLLPDNVIQFNLRSGTHFTLDGAALAYGIEVANAKEWNSFCVLGGDQRRVHFLTVSKA